MSWVQDQPVLGTAVRDDAGRDLRPADATGADDPPTLLGDCSARLGHSTVTAAPELHHAAQGRAAETSACLTPPALPQT